MNDWDDDVGEVCLQLFSPTWIQAESQIGWVKVNMVSWLVGRSKATARAP